MHIEIHFTFESIQRPAANFPNREIGTELEFQGIVRELENGRALQGLQYEAYEPMARQVLAKHFAELAQIHPCESVIFIHRLGWVPVGEASLYIRVLSAHRGEALSFLAESVNRLKLDVPIWKQVKEP
ncbi:molybdenum cofactor biosynthesis protein MoaE [Luteolibacter pohnpeiensis]|uniref:Molybdopterin synthase catalytic subunit n=1 Tax=Luteolibacter pohnpeiensis TaxID=454153 RepID=A0A934SFH0_9BACT|nr:molybdenum cofactor biosynthesis protein MoaE [Luteolibacter pohnpeiensis]MBK1884223.1 molybdenum cofactor biosynthesis protein MoaE [Luteolibacter pohnpeiensis]